MSELQASIRKTDIREEHVLTQIIANHSGKLNSRNNSNVSDCFDSNHAAQAGLAITINMYSDPS
jgi:hypothetical protein